jgi:hypothetical protein
MKHLAAGILLFSLVWLAGFAAAADFTVTTPGGQSNFQVNSVNGNPTITLQRGRTYTFAVATTAGQHPFRIGVSVFGATAAGVTGDNTTSGTVTYAVPTNAANCVYYCGNHGFSGSIQMVNPPTPPPFSIVSVAVSSNVTLRYTATNIFTYTPEFKTNIVSTNWFALTVQTNKLLPGTNEVICGVPPGTNVLIRIRAQ